MQHRDQPYLGHMLDTALQVQVKTAGIDRATFDADENLRLALAYLIQIIGEAAGQVSQAGRVAHPEILWRSITGMRQRIVHDYMNVNFDIVWAVATHDLPDLVAKFEPLL